MRTLASWSRTILSQVMSPTTPTSQRLLIYSSRSPKICMILNSMTTPSAWRSLHHCSPWSEKSQRAVDKLITLLTKVYRPVSRRRSVMLEQGRPISDQFDSLIPNVRENPCRGSENEQIRKSRFSLIVEQRFKNTNSRPFMTEEVSKS